MFFFRQECEQHNRLTKLKDEEMKRRHEIERKRLPKIQRDEIKAKSHQYRKSLRMEKRVSVDIEREMMKEVTSHEIEAFISFLFKRSARESRVVSPFCAP